MGSELAQNEDKMIEYSLKSFEPYGLHGCVSCDGLYWFFFKKGQKLTVTNGSSHLPCMLITGQREALFNVVGTLGF